MPDIDLALIDEIHLEVPSVEINDNDIDRVIDNIRKQNSEWSDSSKEAEMVIKLWLIMRAKLMVKILKITNRAILAS